MNSTVHNKSSCVTTSISTQACSSKTSCNILLLYCLFKIPERNILLQYLPPLKTTVNRDTPEMHWCITTSVSIKIQDNELCIHKIVHFIGFKNTFDKYCSNMKCYQHMLTLHHWYNSFVAYVPARTFPHPIPNIIYTSQCKPLRFCWGWQRMGQRNNTRFHYHIWSSSLDDSIHLLHSLIVLC